MRLAGLIDIAQEKNYQMIRSPVEVGNPQNIRAGTTPAYGRLANVPTAANRRFYADREESIEDIILKTLEKDTRDRIRESPYR